MKTLTFVVLLTASTLLTGICLADEAPTNIIPTQEKAFVDAINKFDQKTILAQFGEPAKTENVKIKDSGKVVASIWHYHHLNTAEDGSYYPTTELDFIDGKVVQVVFLNNDGSEANDGKTYDLQQAPDSLAPNL